MERGSCIVILLLFLQNEHIKLASLISDAVSDNNGESFRLFTPNIIDAVTVGISTQAVTHFA